LHPINEKIKNNYCSYINLETSDENQKKEENKEKDKNVKENAKLKLTTFSFSSLSKENISQKQEIKKEDKKEVESEKNQKSIIPESDLSDEYQNEFTQLFNSFEYQKDQKFPPMTFKKVMSSKGLTSDKLRSAIMNNVVNQGPFLIVLYPSKLEKYYKTHTFFYYNGTFPSLNLTQNFDESDENLTIPYNPQNMIAQISEKNYITASFKSELDNSKDCEFCSVTVEEGSIILNIMEIINLYLTEPKSSNVNPYDNINICQKKGMEDLYYINSISDYEIFIGKN